MFKVGGKGGGDGGGGWKAGNFLKMAATVGPVCPED